jgi:hypothetical protein
VDYMGNETKNIFANKGMFANIPLVASAFA